MMKPSGGTVQKLMNHYDIYIIFKYVELAEANKVSAVEILF